MLRYPIVVALWVLFVAGVLLSVLLPLAYPFSRSGSYVRNIVEAGDRLLAALLGFTGRWTLSVELADPALSRRYKLLHDLLNAVSPGHCEECVYREHPYCRIRDHNLGDR